MPSEVIYGPGGIHTRVSWGSNEEGVVQIVTQAIATGETGTDPTERLITIVNQWLAEAGEPQIDWDRVKAKMSSAPFFDGWWAQLDDWGQCNRLIKVLQRARNRAFGDPA